MSGRALTCWWITNGAAGFRTQARGLAEAVIPGAVEKTVDIKAPWSLAPAALWALTLRGLDPAKDRLEPPWPDVVVSCGRKAGKIDQAVGDLAPVLVFNGDPREYAFRAPSSAYLHHDALIVGRPNTVKQELPRIAPHFASLTGLPEAWVGRGTKDEQALTVIAAHDLTSPYPLPGWAR